MESNKNILLIILTLVILALLAFGLFCLFNPKPVPYYPMEFTADKLVTNQTFINMIINDLKSPLGNNLTKIPIDEDDPRLTVEPWKYAYFICNAEEHIGWIYVSEERAEIKSGLYGPYGWCLI
jgi:hypothetical protein